MRTVTYLSLLAATMVASGCDDTVTGAQPIGGDPPSEASLQRFVRRSTLDLTGTPPAEPDLIARAGELGLAGNTVVARRAQVQALLATQGFARLWTEELENRVLGGESLEGRYDQYCSIVRNNDVACQACATADRCGCSCPAIMRIAAERAQLRTTAADFQAGVASATLERRYADAEAYRVFLGDPDSFTARVFEDFHGRPAELEEREAGRAMIFSFGGPAGLLFHRHGANLDDLSDITLDSEAYREAMVKRVFARYLGRLPGPVELAHFVGQLPAEAPDVRSVITAVMTGKEYFNP